MDKFFSNDKNSVVTSDRILYTPSLFAKNALLYLQEIGTLKANKEHVSKRSNLESFLFFTITEGSGQLIYDGTAHILSAGDCVFIDCKKTYAHMTSPGNLWNLKWVHFYGSSVSAIYEKYLSRGGKPVFKASDQDSFLQLHKDLFDIASSDDHIRDMRINEKLALLLTLIMTETKYPESLSDSEATKDIGKIKTYLEEHYTEKISLDQISSKFYVNKYHLLRLFKKQFGVSIISYMQQLKITKAKQLLRFTDDTIESIGIKAGIGEPNYFSRLFKKIEGVSPSEYRKAWRDSGK